MEQIIGTLIRGIFLNYTGGKIEAAQIQTQTDILFRIIIHIFFIIDFNLMFLLLQKFLNKCLM